MSVIAHSDSSYIDSYSVSDNESDIVSPNCQLRFGFWLLKIYHANEYINLRLADFYPDSGSSDRDRDSYI